MCCTCQKVNLGQIWDITSECVATDRGKKDETIRSDDHIIGTLGIRSQHAAGFELAP